MNLDKLKKRIPYPVKKFAKSLYGAMPWSFRYGKVYWETDRFLQESQWWDREKLLSYQLEQLESLIHHAYNYVPYYRRIFEERGLSPKDIQDLNDLRKLPFLTKEIIRENLPDLTARNYSKDRLKSISTGGTTGGPLKFYVDRKVYPDKEVAFIHNLWRRVDYRLTDKKITLRGNVVHGANKGKIWEDDPFNRALILSSYHITDRSLPVYVKKIEEYAPDYIYAYPSAVMILARLMKDFGIEPFSSVKALLCGSENLYPWQRKYLEQIFKCRVYCWYGHAEQAVLAGGCETSDDYHIFPEYGVVELISNTGEAVEKDNELGEIVATGFNNYALPFIRYKTNDIAVFRNGRCLCGRNYPLITRIEGRKQDFLVTRKGFLVPFSGYSLSLKVSEYIDTFQYYQEEKGLVIVRIVKKKGYTETDTHNILRELNLRYGNDFHFRIELTSHLPRTSSGKFLYLIQKLPIEFGENRIEQDYPHQDNKNPIKKKK